MIIKSIKYNNLTKRWIKSSQNISWTSKAPQLSLLAGYQYSSRNKPIYGTADRSIIITHLWWMIGLLLLPQRDVQPPKNDCFLWWYTLMGVSDRAFMPMAVLGPMCNISSVNEKHGSIFKKNLKCMTNDKFIPFRFTRKMVCTWLS